MIDEGLGHWLVRRRQRSPQVAAIICGDQTVTYSELADAADRIAALLSSHGVAPGDAVAYFGENSPDFMGALFATASLGAVFVPINTRLAGPEIAHILGDCGSRVLIHDLEIADRLEGIGAECEVDVMIPTGTGRGCLQELGAAFEPRREHTPTSLADPAAIIYTSGTTGRPKGAVLTHGNLTWVSINCIIDYDVSSSDIALMISPLFHVASLGMGALPTVLKGGTMVLERRFEPGRALAHIERHRVTMLSGVPTTFQMLSEDPAWEATDLSSLHKLTCGGSPAPMRVIEAFERRDLHFSQGYGMTEASPGVTALSASMTRDKQGSVGLPHFFTHVRVAGPDGAEAPAGVVGEIQIVGPNVTPGYHGLPDANAAAFTADGWFTSGDLGYQDEDGYLFISGRQKDMIISGGENIYPAEVETLLLEDEAITAAAVVAVPDERWGEVPWAVITVADGAVVSPDSVRSRLDGRLARYKVPKRVIIRDELPRTALGKVRKVELRQWLQAGDGSD